MDAITGAKAIYCLKCKKKTETNNVERVISKNNRPRIKGTCVICRSKKSKFVKS